MVEGPDGVNGTYWDNFYISPKDTAKAFNARNFHYLGLCGLTPELLDSADDDDLTKQAAGTRVEVLANYQAKDTGEGRWKRYHYSSVEEAPRVVEVEEDTTNGAELDF